MSASGAESDREGRRDNARHAHGSGAGRDEKGNRQTINDRDGEKSYSGLTASFKAAAVMLCRWISGAVLPPENDPTGRGGKGKGRRTTSTGGKALRPRRGPPKPSPG